MAIEIPGVSLRLRKFHAAAAVTAALAVTFAACGERPSPTEGPIDVVQVDGGLVSGIPTDVDGVLLFKGIPFAAATSGENRFRAPQPVAPWKGVKAADSWPDQAMQDVHLNPVGTFWGDEFYYDPAFLPPASENSLALNVYTPAKGIDDHLPVYVWIHGGANDHGYASEIEFWAPKLAAKGIVVVQVQYRVGPFGFLALQELSDESADGASGNYHLQDLVAALQWVQQYIGGFGGDPAVVTVGGQSAGARNTVSLLRSPKARGLFRRAVVESGFSGILPLEFKSLAQAQADNAAALEKIFGKPMSVADLRAIPAEEFVTRESGDTLLYYALDRAIGEAIADGVYITDDSADLLKPGALDGIDLLIGGTSDERTSQWGGPEQTLTGEEFATSMHEFFGNDDYQAVYKPSDSLEAYRMWLRANNDYEFQRALISAQYAKANNSNNKVFAFYFNHAPPGRNSEFYGAFHSSDLWYFFDSLRDWPGQRHWTDADYRMAETMSTYLANFVKTGDPNGTGLPEWPQPDNGTHFMRFTDGYAYAGDQTPYPARDALQRNTVFSNYGLDAQRLSR